MEQSEGVANRKGLGWRELKARATAQLRLGRVGGESAAVTFPCNLFLLQLTEIQSDIRGFSLHFIDQTESLR